MIRGNGPAYGEDDRRGDAISSDTPSSGLRRAKKVMARTSTRPPSGAPADGSNFDTPSSGPRRVRRSWVEPPGPPNGQIETRPITF